MVQFSNEHVLSYFYKTSHSGALCSGTACQWEPVRKGDSRKVAANYGLGRNRAISGLWGKCEVGKI